MTERRYVLVGPHLSFSCLGTPVPQGQVRHFGKGRPSAWANQETLLPWRDRVQSRAEEAIKAYGRLRGGDPEALAFPLRNAVGLAAHFTRAKPSSAPKTWVTYPIQRPDTSHLLRAIEDALTAAGVYVDDAQIVFETTSKSYPQESQYALHVPGVLIEVFTITDSGDVDSATQVVPILRGSGESIIEGFVA